MHVVVGDGIVEASCIGLAFAAFVERTDPVVYTAYSPVSGP
jgi:hypothetical protein